MNRILKPVLIWLSRRQLHQRRADFYFDIASTLKDRVPLFTTLRKHESRARKRSPLNAPAYLEILKGLQSGSLSLALRGVASPVELTLIDATQAAGDETMAEGLLFLADIVKKTDQMIASMQKACVYPLVLMAVFAALLMGFSANAVPVLVSIMPPERWPPLGQFLYNTSYIVTHHGWWIGLMLLAAFSLFIYALPRWTGPTRVRFDQFLPFNLYRDYASAMLMISLSSLMRSGISLQSALERTNKHSAPWARWHIKQILINLSKPNNGSFGNAFYTGLVSPEMEDRIQDASERSNSIEAFIHIGVGSMDRMIVLVDKRSKQVNSLLMVLCGGFLAILMLGFFSTTQSLQSGLRTPQIQLK